MSAVKRFDLYLLFIEQGFDLLSRNGRLGYICPHKFANSDFGSGLRDFLLRHRAIESFVSFGNNLVIEQASTYTSILLLHKSASSAFFFYEFEDMPALKLRLRLAQLNDVEFAQYEYQNLTGAPWMLMSASSHALLKKLCNQP